MKEIVLKIQDNAFDDFLGMIRHCPCIEVVSTSQNMDSKENIDQCFQTAISELRKDRVFRTKGDYGYIMLAVNDEAVKGLFFYSPLDYRSYLKELGFDDLPGQSTLYDTCKKVGGRYPEWGFSDHPDSKERLRRNNIVVRFVSVFNRAKRSLSEGFSEKQP